MTHSMRGLYDLCRAPKGKLLLNLGVGMFAITVSVLAARHFAGIGWPFAGANVGLVAAAGVLFLVAYAFKAYGWHRLFAPHERPRPLTLGAACGAASVTGAALPGRFDDVVRVAVVRRATNGRAGVGPVCLSLFMLGLIDTAALMPLAGTAAATADASGAVRAALAVVAFAGFGAAIVIAVLPRLIASGRLIRFRIARWLGERVIAPRDAWQAWVLVLASWLTRAFGLFLLLHALGFALSLPLAIAFLCAAAASGALPIAPAGAATQAGAGAAILMASGVGTADAVSFAVGAQALLILAGAAVLAFAALWHGGRRLALAVL
jgi:Lysylphosphatidylglycerol synthase TM region